MSDALIWDSFRRYGHLAARLDPLGRLLPVEHPALQAKGKEAERARAAYCGSIGAEFLHVEDPERVGWIAERLEGPAPQFDRSALLDQLIRAEVFEQVAQTRYLGAKRYSLEGNTALIPLLHEMLQGAGERGALQAVMCMSHRGRLNVLVNIVGKDPADVFSQFEDVDPRSILGAGDVKYHIGATGTFTCRQGGPMRISLVSNPSHLEAVNPVAMGRTRAKQARFGDHAWDKVVPITQHGDAAFAGQGITAETLNLAGLPGFTVGGTIHVVVNNLIGFTATPPSLHSTRYSTDLAKRLPIPIFHVNGEDPEAVLRVAQIALEYRYKFWSDVVVDLIGYRRHGHSEVDDPSVTQPLLYHKVQSWPLLWKSYGKQIGEPEEATAARQQTIRNEMDEHQSRAKKMKEAPVLRTLPGYWDAYAGGDYDPAFEVPTGITQERLQEISSRITRWPDSFHIHSKVKRLLEERREMGEGKRPVDWGMAEHLAFASLLWEGTRIRLEGEDSRRGTFNQRHSVLVDAETEQEYVPLRNLHAGQAIFEAYDSALSEAAPLGFEYGFSRDFPEALVMWEAQFGDFANCAQTIIDQFASATEDKWGLLSGLVMLLPHGYEGQGPEHSNARPERFLQLCGEDNMQVCQPSGAAQYFHLLRRQALRRWRKPLVVFTPKGFLRHPRATSSLAEFSRDRFLTVLPDQDLERADRVLLCWGKIGHELKAEREKRKETSTAIVLLEQMYPFPEKELAAELDRLAARTIVWVQEEPANMGAQAFVMPQLQRIAGSRPVRSIKRSASASPATGSGKAHGIEQATLLAMAFHD